MSEKRLIDAMKLIDALPVVTEDKPITLYGAVADFMVMISAMPTEDAVEVVRCKDCKHSMRDEGGLYWCEIFDDGYHNPNYNDFCSYGERINND